MHVVAPVLYTERLRLRSFRTDDARQLARYYGDPLVMRHIGDGRRLNGRETGLRVIAYLDHWSDFGFGMWAVEDQQGQLLGRAGLVYLDASPEVEVGYILGRKFWGRGYATEAARAALAWGFEHLPLDEIVAVTKPENAASQRVLLKAGLQAEGLATFYGGEVTYFRVRRAAWEPAR